MSENNTPPLKAAPSSHKTPSVRSIGSVLVLPLRRKFSRLFQRKEKIKPTQSESVIESIHSPENGFLHELIQYLDDCSYNNKIPTSFLGFIVTECTLIIETNENNFPGSQNDPTSEVGTSKRENSVHHSLGETGKNYQSILPFVSDLPIRSGSIAFHRNTNAKTEFHISPSNRSAYRKFQRDLKGLRAIDILFLKKLEKISFRIDLGDGLTCASIQKSCVPESGLLTIRHLDNQSTTPKELEQYYVFSNNSDRVDAAREKIEVAFPVHATTQTPLISEDGHNIFAGRPLQRFKQFKFLVQSDFTTSPDEPDQISDCQRNAAIWEGVGELFCEAIRKFATKDHPLEYSWLEYLPGPPLEGIWPTVVRQLQEMPILKSWENGKFKRPVDLRYVHEASRHEGVPILGDLTDHEQKAIDQSGEIYLSPKFDMYVDKVKAIGVKQIGWKELLDRLQADLDIPSPYYGSRATLGTQSPISQLKSRSSDDPWHETFAELFVNLLRDPDLTDLHEEMKRMRIIPLRDGTVVPWKRFASASEVYFPYTEGIAVPMGISVKLVYTDSVKRKAFYRAMGVSDCPTDLVLTHIRHLHDSLRSVLSESSRSLPIIPDILDHFIYLFHFHPVTSTEIPWLLVPTHNSQLQPINKPVYLLSNTEYGTQQLLLDQDGTDHDGIAMFFMQELLDLEPPTESKHVPHHGLPFRKWLENVTAPRYSPPLVDTTGNSTKLSEIFLAVLERKPEKFVGMLKADWPEYKESIPAHLSELQQLKVLSETGQRVELRSTYLPTPQIREQLKRFKNPSLISLLKLPLDLDESNRDEWMFLKEVGVRTEPDGDFYRLFLAEMGRTGALRELDVAWVQSKLPGLESAEDRQSLQSYTERILLKHNSVKHVFGQRASEKVSTFALDGSMKSWPSQFPNATGSEGVKTTPLLHYPIKNAFTPEGRDSGWPSYESWNECSEPKFSWTGYDNKAWTPAEYCVLIDQVRQSARTAGTTSRQSYNRTGSLSARYSRSNYGVMIGALGEAYVLEILSGLNLPTFSRTHFMRNNWYSFGRRFLEAHDDFPGKPYPGIESKGKFQYIDHDGTLTSYFKEKCVGGFPGDSSTPRKGGATSGTGDETQLPITYWIEIKCTTSSSSTAFNLDQAQYSWMEKTSLYGYGSTRDKSRTLYVILHVYNLGTQIGMNIFVDPWRLQGTILDTFRTDRYSKWGSKLRTSTGW
ncbi:hypothetical protein P154DRAFT_569823 [Amniculicola lignicola CBS 123094]|uniref:Protein NO VEIN C-terminal domain-containing protein n=1 Tax=Amniculicola lignicola CBS 123094 TaxID=1392246 RepID=A0A6A5X301_9PLEO|nr:hypothetical protein P154DRAFT_569823 [Amniculicola lignicola CBS 123094]